MYGQDGVDTGFDFDVLNVDTSGVRVGTTYGSIFPEFNGQSYFDRITRLVYSDDGRVFDPATGTFAGTFNLANFTPYACLPDPGQPVVFFLGRDGSSPTGFTLRAFDKNTYGLIGSLRIPAAGGYPMNLTRWGRAGIAFSTTPVYPTDTAAIYFVDGGFINWWQAPDITAGPEAEVLPVFTAIAPESATAGSAGLVLTISGSDFRASAAVRWNGQPLATTYQSSTGLQAVVPASNLAQTGTAVISVTNGSSSYSVNSMAFTILPASNGMIARNLSSLDIAWDPHSFLLYAPVWSADPQYPNSIVAIDPASGGISKVAGVAPDPAILRISRDGTLGYTGYRIASLVTQFHVPALDSTTTWGLGGDAFMGPYMAMDLQPAPDTASTTAISIGTPDFIAQNRGLVVFDNAVARQRRLSDSNLYDTLQWGLTDSILYAGNNESSGFDFYTLGVDAAGATLLRIDPGLMASVSRRIHFDRATGYLYCDNGYVIDPATGGHVGQYGASGLLVPDSSLNRVFVLHPAPVGGTYTIDSFDQSRFAPVGSLAIPSLAGDPVAFIRWGTSGLAIVTYNSFWGPTFGPAGMLHILDNPTFVSASQPVQAGVENLTVGLTSLPGRAAVRPSESIK